MKAAKGDVTVLVWVLLPCSSSKATAHKHQALLRHCTISLHSQNCPADCTAVAAALVTHWFYESASASMAYDVTVMLLLQPVTTATCTATLYYCTHRVS
jgi:hypothetical protein